MKQDVKNSGQPIALPEREATDHTCPETRPTTAPTEPRRVLIVGRGEMAAKVAAELRRSSNRPCEVVGFVGEQQTATQAAEDCLGNSSDIMDIVSRHAINEVIVVDQPTWHDSFLSGIFGNGHRNIEVKVVPSVYEAMLGMLPLCTLDDVPLVTLGRKRRKSTYSAMKPWLDRVIALCALAISLPLLLTAVLAIKITSPGPAIYSQERVGKGGQSFTLHKVRTMVNGAETNTGPILSHDSDERVTSVGRFLRATKIDELPQLINVVKGEMSLVGPRPERPCFVREFEQRVACYRERHVVAPGITGLAQVYGDYATPVETKLRYDLMYVFNQSFLLDVKVVALTVVELAKGLKLPTVAKGGVSRSTRWQW